MKYANHPSKALSESGLDDYDSNPNNSNNPNISSLRYRTTSSNRPGNPSNPSYHPSGYNPSNPNNPHNTSVYNNNPIPHSSSSFSDPSLHRNTQLHHPNNPNNSSLYRHDYNNPNSHPNHLSNPNNPGGHALGYKGPDQLPAHSYAAPTYYGIGICLTSIYLHTIHISASLSLRRPSRYLSLCVSNDNPLRAVCDAPHNNLVKLTL